MATVLVIHVLVFFVINANLAATCCSVLQHVKYFFVFQGCSDG